MYGGRYGIQMVWVLRDVLRPCMDVPMTTQEGGFGDNVGEGQACPAACDLCSNRKQAVGMQY